MDAVNFLNVEYLFLRVSDFFNNFDLISFLNAVIHFMEAIAPYLMVIVVFLVWLLAYSYFSLRKVDRKVDKELYTPVHSGGDAVAASPQDVELAQKWHQVQAHISSANPSDWRLAILEADIMLADMLDRMGYQGDSIGEQLKGVEKSDFLTLDQAWSAHKVRNQIAHQGSDFQLNQREAEHVIGLYKEVFEEFYKL